MATTGYFDGPQSSKGWYARLEYSYTQTTSATNITLTLKVYDATGSSHNNYPNEAYYIIQGSKTYQTYQFDSIGWYTIASKTVSVTDTSATSLAVSATWCSENETTWTPYSLSVSGTITFPQITPPTPPEPEPEPEPPTPSVNVISVQPIPNFIAGYEGDSFTLTCNPSGGTGYTYKWYKYSDSYGDSVVIDESQTLTGTLHNVNWDNNYIYCVVTDSTGGTATTNWCQLRIGTAESQTQVSTKQVEPVRVYNGSSFIDAIPFIKIEENGEDKIIYCGWKIEEDKGILYLISSILVFNRAKGKGLIISPKEIEEQFSFNCNYFSKGKGNQIFSENLIKNSTHSLNYLKKSSSCLLLPKENRFQAIIPITFKNNNSFGQLVPSEFSANTIWVLPIEEKARGFGRRIKNELNSLFKNEKILVDSDKKGLLVKTFLEEQKEDLNLSFDNLSKAHEIYFKNNSLEKEEKVSYFHIGNISKIFWTSNFIDSNLFLSYLSTGKMGKVFPKEFALKLNFSFMTFSESHPNLLPLKSTTHQGIANVSLSLVSGEPILYQIKWEYPQVEKDTIYITQAFYVSVENDIITIF